MVNRSTLTPAKLYQAATQGRIDLSPEEKNRISPDCLFALALTDRVRLLQSDRDRLRDTHLAQLAICEKLELTHDDKTRLSPQVLFDLFAGGYTSLSPDEMQSFDSPQREALLRLEARGELVTSGA